MAERQPETETPSQIMNRLIRTTPAKSAYTAEVRARFFTAVRRTPTEGDTQ